MVVLVAYATDHGSTRGVADRIASRLRLRGVGAEAHAIADVPDVVVQPGGLMDDYHTRERPRAIRENQIRPAQRFGPHDPSLACWRPALPGHRPGTAHTNTKALNYHCESEN